MNKIYKLVWSKTRNMYIAVCEFAKSHTKSPKSNVISRTVMTGVLACVLSCGAVMPVYAAGSGSYEAGGASASGSRSVAIGPGVTASSTGSVAIGNNTNNVSGYGGVYTVSGEYSIAIGSGAYAVGQRSSALGNDAVSVYAYSVSIGNYSVTNAENTVSFGHSATDYDYGGTAYGSDYYRRLTYVADGTDNHDVATWGQTKTETRPSENGNYVAGFSAS